MIWLVCLTVSYAQEASRVYAQLPSLSLPVANLGEDAFEWLI
jgi:hypothetical protein